MLRRFIFLTMFCFSVAEAQSGGCFNPCDSCARPNFYVGGNFLYSVTNLPQNIVSVDYEAFDSKPNVFDDGSETITQKTDRESCRWNFYVGYEQPFCPCWLLGVEVDYRDLGKTETCYVGPLNPIPPGLALEDELERAFCNSCEKDPVPFRNVRSYSIDGLLTLRYQMCNGFNAFVKGGFSWIRMQLKDGNFYSGRQPTLSFKGPFAPQDFTYYNVYPEIVIGGGYRFTNCLNFTFSYGHIYGPKNTARYIQQLTGDSNQILKRPNQCASYDFITVGVDISLGQLFGGVR